MSESSNLQYWPEGIAAARIPANNNVRLLQALLLNPAISATTAAQPGSPAEGDVYILPAAPSGAQWASFFEDDVVIYYDATWTAYIPNDGLRKFVEDEGEDWQFVGGSSGGWAAAGGGGGGMSNPMTTAEDIIVGGASGTPTRLAKGADGTVLTVVAGSLAYATPSGGGDVVGPASAVDDRIATFDGVTGKLLQDGGKVVSDLVDITSTQTVGGDKTFTGTNTFDQNITRNAAAGNSRYVGYRTAGVLRWNIGSNSTAEGGSNAGSDFVLNRYNDAGTLIASALTVTRSTGNGAWGADWTANAINDVAGDVRNIPQRSVSAATSFALTDKGGHVYHPSADTTARTWTIPANASVAFPVGTAITIVNDTSAGALTIAITTDTLVWQPTGGTGSRTLAANGSATLLKVTSTRWIITGVGLT